MKADRVLLPGLNPLAAINMHLKIKEITDETIDTKTIHFWQPIHNAVHYLSGQFLTVIPEIEGKKVRRSYSLSSSPKTDMSPAITVKRIEGGLVSNFLCDTLKEGDSLEVLEPMGNFSVEADSSATKTYVFVGAGSGITPLLSMIKTLLHGEPLAKIHLIYGSRHEDQIIFKKVLNSLESLHANRFKVYLFNWCAIGFAFWVFRAHARQIFRNANEHSLRSLIYYCVHHFCNLSLECMGHQTSWSEHRWRLHLFTTNPCNDYCSDFKERYFKHL
jgi:ferredoxin-NADP reductase